MKQAEYKDAFEDHSYYYVDRTDIEATITGFIFSPESSQFAISDSAGNIRIFEILGQ